MAAYRTRTRRIQPRRALTTLRDSGTTAFVTLHHFTLDAGALRIEKRATPFPDGATGWHTVTVG